MHVNILYTHFVTSALEEREDKWLGKTFTNAEWFFACKEWKKKHIYIDERIMYQNFYQNDYVFSAYIYAIAVLNEREIYRDVVGYFRTEKCFFFSSSLR